MARKKQEIQLQREIETQEEWEEVMAMEGLWVVDVYQEWCGPCSALVGNFRRLKNELGDQLLNFAIAKADSIDALERYRGRCEPTFLFFAGGILVSFIHGANSPKVQRVITEQLAQEHKVLEGQGERKEVKDPIITRNQEREQERMEAEEAAREAEVPKGVTVAFIKPDAVAAGKTEAILAELEEHGLEILAKQERELTDDEAREIYVDLEGESFFEELIKFVTSGPSQVLVLTSGTTGETVIKDWRELIGPSTVEEAKEEAPDSLRAKYGEKGYMNALHGSSTKDQAARELAFFFPNLAIPVYMKKKENIQRTLALIRPEAFAASKDAIMEKIEEAGFHVALYKEVQLSKDQAGEFYKEHVGNAYYDELCSLMSNGPLLALGLARDEAIDGWREMLGPTNVDEALESKPNSLRAKFVAESGINQFHGSDSVEAAKKEIDFFFPMQETVAVIKPDGMGTKDEIIKRIHEAGFRIAAHKETIITKEIADILYPDHEEKDYYEDLINSITSGPTYFMVLSRENAVEGWRKEVGLTNPEEAKASDPKSLRALFGMDILQNAVHGSSNVERAREEMKAVFGDLEFNEDGTVKGEQPDLDEATVATDDTTTMETTTMDQDTTQAPSADVTADETQNETQADTTVADTTVTDTSMGDTTMADTTMADTTMDTTTADTTTADTDTVQKQPEASPIAEESEQGAGDQTADQTTTGETTADSTTVDATTADTTTVDATTADTTTADATEEQQPAAAASPTADSPGESQAQEGDSQAPQEAESIKQSEEATVKEEESTDKKAEEKAEEQKADEQKAEEQKAEEQKAEEQKAESPVQAEGTEKAAEETSSEQKQEESPKTPEESKESEAKDTQEKKEEAVAEPAAGDQAEAPPAAQPAP